MARNTEPNEGKPDKRRDHGLDRDHRSSGTCVWDDVWNNVANSALVEVEDFWLRCGRDQTQSISG